jgi:hypothetical protein
VGTCRAGYLASYCTVLRIPYFLHLTQSLIVIWQHRTIRYSELEHHQFTTGELRKSQYTILLPYRSAQYHPVRSYAGRTANEHHSTPRCFQHARTDPDFTTSGGENRSEIDFASHRTIRYRDLERHQVTTGELRESHYTILLPYRSAQSHPVRSYAGRTANEHHPTPRCFQHARTDPDFTTSGGENRSEIDFASHRTIRYRELERHQSTTGELRKSHYTILLSYRSAHYTPPPVRSNAGRTLNEPLPISYSFPVFAGDTGRNRYTTPFRLRLYLVGPRGAAD